MERTGGKREVQGRRLGGEKKKCREIEKDS